MVSNVLGWKSTVKSSHELSSRRLGLSNFFCSDLPPRLSMLAALLDELRNAPDITKV
jgi:hypothetical protein